MNINHLIFQNLKKNIKNYYLYVFALVFSAALYFAFVTMQYDPALDEMKSSIKGAAAIRAASILLVAIVSVFLLYANTIFIKRRSKEIGLFQLIGMTKMRIFRILSAENFILYFTSIWIGIFVGFSFSKLCMMILFHTVGVKASVSLFFSSKALVQTLVVFGVIYVLIMIMNYLFIKRQSILSLFKAASSSEQKMTSLSWFQMVIGMIGIACIIAGYAVSSKLFGGSFTSMNELFLAMVFILGSVIIGTYLFYKGSVSFLANLIRKSKGGYLNVSEVLSLSSIMFRMKSNAVLLTIITTLSALSIGLLSLSYISYYSAEKSAEQNVAADFAMNNQKEADSFTALLRENGIQYHMKKIKTIQADANVKHIINGDMSNFKQDPSHMALPIVSEKDAEGVSLSDRETVFTGYNDMMQKFLSLKESGRIEMNGKRESISLSYSGLRRDFILPYIFTSGLPIAIVSQHVFDRLEKDIDPVIQKKTTLFFSITLKNEDELKAANDLFQAQHYSDDQLSRFDLADTQKKNMGLMMFIVGFLGLTFLITSGCILYFKQMGECEDERSDYTILRKLGFTQGDLLKGIRRKQVYNFGIPLILGLFHSYFAVQSGWFLFGTEVWTPMIIVMALYTVLYSIFGMLSVLYYKKVIHSALS
ncbi:ABC transporter permease [Bacillus sp. ISL-51]|uniref:FtsX-like permease family protein n=1 Tax=Bacteria TaxID=2 RepID=UPI001BE7703C|nr:MULTISPECIES: ABC transporter permease [Bacteria]MBT2575795.1 ABC transporter permease [Bacillus sp. ISL-51]MBT2635847.1 ABC transporter permease [Bacillus sp. ISL-26]MBT2714023.1 ABC transporter permease [Pseudomonas sp. ISL-88]